MGEAKRRGTFEERKARSIKMQEYEDRREKLLSYSLNAKLEAMATGVGATGMGSTVVEESDDVE